MALARANDPATSHEAAATVPVAGTDKNRPTKELKEVLLETAEVLHDFTDREVSDIVEEGNPWTFDGVPICWSAERVRGGMKWLRDKGCMLLIGRRDGKRLWRLRSDAAELAQ
jgi:hypothetical protein